MTKIVDITQFVLYNKRKYTHFNEIERLADNDHGTAAEPHSCRGIFNGHAKRGSVSHIVMHHMLQAPQHL